MSAMAAAAGAAQPLAAPLSVASIWLARPPPAVHRGVWEVACLAAVAAMDHGRRRMYAMSTGPPPAAPLHTICARSAVARFWELLADFVVLGCAPGAWRTCLSSTHPFVAFDPGTSSFRVHRPGP